MSSPSIPVCPYCYSENIFFSRKNKKYCCEDCGKMFDKPTEPQLESEEMQKMNMIRDNTVDTRRVKAFLASSIKLTTERDLIGTIAAESNGKDHRTYIELNRCEYDNSIQLNSSQQEMYNNWIKESDVFILIVPKNGIGEWTACEIELAAEMKRTQKVKIYALVQNGADSGFTPENLRWQESFTAFKESFDEILGYDDISDLYVKAVKLIETIRSDTSVGTVIKDCRRKGYDIVIAGASDKSREFIYSLANKFNMMNNEFFRENAMDSLIFNLKIVADDFSGFRTDLNDYYFIVAGRNEDVNNCIKQCYHSNNPYLFLDVNVFGSGDDADSLVREISHEINDNYLSMFTNKETLIGKDIIRDRMEIIKSHYRTLETGIKKFADQNYYEAEKYLLEASEFGFADADFYLGYIYSDETHDFADLDKSEKYWLMASEKGHSTAQFNLGLMYIKQGNKEKAEKYYRMSADQGNEQAQCNLGLLLKEQGNIQEAEKYCLMSAEQGFDLGMYNLALMLYEEGKEEESEKYYRMAADLGNVGAQSNLGLLLAESGNKEEAEKYCRLAADQGHTVAQNNLGIFLCRSGNPYEAKKYFRLAAEQGNVSAQENLESLNENMAEIEKKYRAAAQQGDVDAIFNLGLMFDEYWENMEEAKKYYRMAALQGHSSAQFNLGILLCDEGKIYEAIKYFRLAAKQGYVKAQENLEVMKKIMSEKENDYRAAAQQGDTEALFDLGQLLEEYSENTEEAKKYYRLAAEQGHIGAQNNLGTMFFNEDNMEEAEKFWRMAADGGYAGAQYNLGILLEYMGKADEAMKYYRLAAEQGHPDALNRLALPEERPDEE